MVEIPNGHLCALCIINSIRPFIMLHIQLNTRVKLSQPQTILFVYLEFHSFFHWFSNCQFMVCNRSTITGSNSTELAIAVCNQFCHFTLFSLFTTISLHRPLFSFTSQLPFIVTLLVNDSNRF